MAIDLQEEELTFLQKKEAVNKKQLGDTEPHTHTQVKHDSHQSLEVSPDECQSRGQEPELWGTVIIHSDVLLCLNPDLW